MDRPVNYITNVYLKHDTFTKHINKLGLEREYRARMEPILRPLIIQDIESLFMFMADVNHCDLNSADRIYRNDLICSQTIIECYRGSFEANAEAICANFEKFDSEFNYPDEGVFDYDPFDNMEYIYAILQCFVDDSYLQKRLTDMFYKNIVEDGLGINPFPDTESDSKRRKIG